MGANKQAIYTLGLSNIGIGEKLIQKEQLTVVKLPPAPTDDKCKVREKPQVDPNMQIYLTKCKILGKKPEFKFSEDYKTLIEYTGSSLQVKIPPVEIIEYKAFYGNNLLESIIIPDSVKKIGENAFSRCSSLTNIVIPSSVRENRKKGICILCNT